jgi:phosphoglycolate phosphatase
MSGVRRVNVLFDLDGTLTDPREGILGCINHALRSLGQPVPPEEVLERFIGPPLRSIFGELLGASSGGEQVEAAVDLYRERFSSVGMFENLVYDGIPDVLAALSSRGARLFVATSKPRVFAEQILEHFGLARYFDAVYGSELDGRLSEKADLVGHALLTSRLSAAETLMVGDRRHDIVGALRHQVTPVGVLWGYGSEDELVAAGARRLLREPREAAGLAI